MNKSGIVAQVCNPHTWVAQDQKDTEFEAPSATQYDNVSKKSTFQNKPSQSNKCVN